MHNCNFQLNDDGLWQCAECEWVFPRKTENPPKRACRKESEVPSLQQQQAQESFGLGDAVSNALGIVGITEERVSAWLGRPCGCPERRERLNRLGRWAAGIVSGTVEEMKQNLESLFKEKP